MLKVRDMMTSTVVSVDRESTLREAMEILSSNHLSGAPVVTGDFVVGVVSVTDIVGFIVGVPARSPEREQESIVESWETADDGLDEEAEKVQLLSMSQEVWEDWSKGGDNTDSFPAHAGLLEQQSIEEIMTSDVISISPDASIKSAATLMRKHGIHRVLVTEGKSLVGIISSLDVARAVSEGSGAHKKGE